MTPVTPRDAVILPFSAPIPPDDVPRFTAMATDLKDWLGHCRTFAGHDTTQLWTQPAETARAFQSALDCMAGAGSVEPDWAAADEGYPIEHVQGWAAIHKPGALVDALAYEMAAAWYPAHGTRFSRPTHDIHGDRLLPAGIAGRATAAQIEEAEAPRGVVVQLPISPPGAMAARFNLLTPSDLSNLPPMRWLVRGVLPESGLAAIYGPPGCGKSFLTLDLMGAIAEGRPWFSHNVTAAPCVYLALEGEAGVSQRVAAYTSKHGSPENLRVILSPLDIRKPDDRRELVAAIKGAGMAGGVLALDTLNRAAPGADENDSRAMGELIDALKALQVELGGLVLAVHHSGKDQGKGLRGHSSLLAALDAVLEVTRQEGRREWRTAKAKDAGDDAAHPFALNVAHLGQDADGAPITSCTIQPEGQAADSVRRIKVPAGGNQRIVWDALGELLRFAPVPDSPPEGLPPGRACIRLDDAIEKVRDRLAVEPDRKTERTRQAITGLVTKGLLTLRDGFLWCP